jgi:hypothetical protein
MSRAYRIRVSESLSRILRASDRVSTQLELLAVLPVEETAALLAAELERAGFEGVDGVFVRRDGSIQVEVDPSNGNVVVQAEGTRAFEQVLTRDGWSAAERTEQQARDRDRLAGQVRQQLETEAQSETDKLQRLVTDRLEQALLDIRPQLDRIVNRVTVEALKRKAAAMGRVKSIAEDADGGSLTIVLEV